MDIHNLETPKTTIALAHRTMWVSNFPQFDTSAPNPIMRHLPMKPLSPNFGPGARLVTVSFLALSVSSSLIALLINSYPGETFLGRAAYWLQGGYSILLPLCGLGSLAALLPLSLLGARGRSAYVPLIGAALTPIVYSVTSSGIPSRNAIGLCVLTPCLVIASLGILNGIGREAAIATSARGRLTGSALCLSLAALLTSILLGVWSTSLHTGLSSTGIMELEDAITREYPAARRCACPIVIPTSFSAEKSGESYLGPLEFIGVNGFYIPSTIPGVAAILITPAPSSRADELLLELQACKSVSMSSGIPIPILGGGNDYLLLYGSDVEGDQVSVEIVTAAIGAFEELLRTAPQTPRSDPLLPVFFSLRLDDLIKRRNSTGAGQSGGTAPND